ncbi:MAG: RluA family pseudouridine synthase [Ferrovibrio sp.]|uniref:RluA family pseudouridine synthase n=1 Tax=Ferrovibrio sp. TaxID=1917215 RepID=UPI00262E4DF1|nr:RluA family pseudouridine synthase [Ferrovibrio sp.]MCW0234528.1 RluA family pseudouridine synthase [Ferrovibrio sp.]
MSQVTTRTVKADEAELRLDRWFKRHFPWLGHAKLEKLLRTGQVRIDGGRAKAATRLEVGQEIRIPPLGDPPKDDEPRISKPARASPERIAELEAAVLHKDDAVIVLNKPAGLATQGGTGLTEHLDGLLGFLKFGNAERPRLVHRLDKDTSGVLLLARSASAAAKLAEALRKRDAHKLYWALVMGVPIQRMGKIELALSKLPGAAGERMVADEEDGKNAVTLYRTIETAGRRAAWLGMAPLTGRTHQLRVHAAAIGTPIVGDGKYGGAEAFLTGGVSRKLHLHARGIRLAHPDGGKLEIRAPLPPHMAATWDFLGFTLDKDADAWLEE